jgi:hypothetical protein
LGIVALSISIARCDLAQRSAGIRAIGTQVGVCPRGIQ